MPAAVLKIIDDAKQVQLDASLLLWMLLLLQPTSR
jgi:hypothetical protein